MFSTPESSSLIVICRFSPPFSEPLLVHSAFSLEIIHACWTFSIFARHLAAADFFMGTTVKTEISFAAMFCSSNRFEADDGATAKNKEHFIFFVFILGGEVC